MGKEHGPRIPNSIYLFYKDTKGCKEIYNILIANKREQIKLRSLCPILNKINLFKDSSTLIIHNFRDAFYFNI